MAPADGYVERTRVEFSEVAMVHGLPTLSTAYQDNPAELRMFTASLDVLPTTSGILSGVGPPGGVAVALGLVETSPAGAFHCHKPRSPPESLVPKGRKVVLHVPHFQKLIWFPRLMAHRRHQTSDCPFSDKEARPLQESRN